MAAEVGEIDQTDWRDVVLSNPVECRAEVCAPSATGFELHWLRGSELLSALDRRVTVNHVNGFWLRLFGNCRDFTCKLLQLQLSDRARRVDGDHDLTQAPALDRRQVQAGSDIAPIGRCPAIIRRCCSRHKVPQDSAPILPRLAAFGQWPFNPRRLVATRLGRPEGLLRRDAPLVLLAALLGW